MDLGIMLSNMRAYIGFFSWFFGELFFTWSDEKCGYLDLPQGFGKDFGISYSSADFLTSEIQLFWMRSIPKWPNNLSFITNEFCCQTILYMLFSNSLAPCNLRLARNSWNSSKASCYETGGKIRGPIGGTWTYPSIRGVWGRSWCNRTYDVGIITPCEWGGGVWLIVVVLTTVSRAAEERVSIQPLSRNVEIRDMEIQEINVDKLLGWIERDESSCLISRAIGLVT